MSERRGMSLRVGYEEDQDSNTQLLCVEQPRLIWRLKLSDTSLTWPVGRNYVPKLTARAQSLGRRHHNAQYEAKGIEEPSNKSFSPVK